MQLTIDPRLRRGARTIFQVVAACLIVIVGSGVILGSCAGQRPTLGSLPPSIPPGSSTTIVSTTAPPATPSKDLRLGPDNLLGWIATPVGDPEVYAEPTATAKKLDIGPKTEAGAPTTFAIVGDGSPDATPEVSGWYRVALPTRPNGSTGWVQVASVTVAKTPFRIFVDLRGRTLRVEKDGEGVFTAAIAIGTPDNPTPVNGTYVTELIQNTKPDGAYGPYAFGLALHSDTLTEFGGGDGQVGIHGTNQPQLIGKAVSHGCVRLKNSDVKDLVDLQLPLGVPVFIT